MKGYAAGVDDATLWARPGGARFCCNFGLKIFDSAYPLPDLENTPLNGREAAV